MSSIVSSKRVVITGVGFLSALGNNEREFLANFLNSEAISSKIKEFDPVSILGPGSIRGLDRNSLISLCAAKQAIDNSGVNLSEFDPSDVGVSLGTIGSPYSGYDFYKVKILENPRYVNPMQFPNTVVNAAASQIGIRFGFSGLNATVSTGLCAGLDAIIYAYNMILRGHAKLILAGGTEELLPEVNNVFNFAGKDNISEAAAILTLESLDSAIKRRALILAELKGFSQKIDVKSKPRESLLLKDNDIDCIISYNELEGHHTLKKYILSKITGNVYGATGALASVASILLIRNHIHKNILVSVNSCYGHYSSLALGNFNE